jgi:hypothetical protein
VIPSNQEIKREKVVNIKPEYSTADTSSKIMGMLSGGIDLIKEKKSKLYSIYYCIEQYVDPLVNSSLKKVAKHLSKEEREAQQSKKKAYFWYRCRNRSRNNE